MLLKNLFSDFILLFTKSWKLLPNLLIIIIWDLKLKLDFTITPKLLNDERCWKNDGKLNITKEHEDTDTPIVIKAGVYDLSSCVTSLWVDIQNKMLFLFRDWSKMALSIRRGQQDGITTSQNNFGVWGSIFGNFMKSCWSDINIAPLPHFLEVWLDLY